MTDPNPENLNETTPTDPRLDALLDEALSPGDVPAGLNDRILAATADRFTKDVDDAPAVIGKIGGGFAWRSIAAVLLFALILGGVWVANQDAEPGNNGTLAGGETVERTQLDTTQIESVLDQLAEAELEADWLDDRIDILSMQVTWAQDKRDAGVWGDGAFDSLDIAIAQETFDDAADEMEWYF
ncbi:MAG: hypothetical protein AAF911_09600 [Planctomycetota bacterium]